MRLPSISGTIRRRILVNFRVQPEVIQVLLPAPFRPKLHDGHAVAGICLIRLEDIRPWHLPAVLGVRSENAAHRIAVCWTGDDGAEHEGVYIPRRDTSSLFNHLVGGRLFPGHHHRARFQVRDDEQGIDFAMQARDGDVAVELRGRTADRLPATSRFGSLDEASAFFRQGSLGYSPSARGQRLDGLNLLTRSWSVEPLSLQHVYSSFFSDRARFPEGSIEFDCALVMRNIEHEWRTAAAL
ncbi:MAG: DUF2071 domain-containing protein [Kofleriaceae bacterium]